MTPYAIDHVVIEPLQRQTATLGRDLASSLQRARDLERALAADPGLLARVLLPAEQEELPADGRMPAERFSELTTRTSGARRAALTVRGDGQVGTAVAGGEWARARLVDPVLAGPDELHGVLGVTAAPAHPNPVPVAVSRDLLARGRPRTAARQWPGLPGAGTEPGPGVGAGGGGASEGLADPVALDLVSSLQARPGAVGPHPLLRLPAEHLARLGGAPAATSTSTNPYAGALTAVRRARTLETLRRNPWHRRAWCARWRRLRASMRGSSRCLRVRGCLGT